MRRINDPQLLMDALERFMEIREKQEQETRKQLGEFLGRRLGLAEEPGRADSDAARRDEQGRFTGEARKETGDA
jgi:hypothetical protein